jgi:hypothetical protein
VTRLNRTRKWRSGTTSDLVETFRLICSRCSCFWSRTFWTTSTRSDLSCVRFLTTPSSHKTLYKLSRTRFWRPEVVTTLYTSIYTPSSRELHTIAYNKAISQISPRSLSLHFNIYTKATESVFHIRSQTIARHYPSHHTTLQTLSHPILTQSQLTALKLWKSRPQQNKERPTHDSITPSTTTSLPQLPPTTFHSSGEQFYINTFFSHTSTHPQP